MSKESCLPHAAQHAPLVSNTAVMGQIVSTVFFTFLCYLAIGIPLAILPSYVHLDLGYSSVVAGLAISVQYLATLLSRPHAGRTADTVGPKQTVLYGLLACGVSGALLFVSALWQHMPGLSLLALLASRLALGCGESFVGTGAITWGIGQVGATHTARVISWNGVATYGALAVGAPVGVALERAYGFSAIGVVVIGLALAGFGLAQLKRATAIVHGEKLAFRAVLGRVLPHGLGLALGSVGFGAIATFVTLFYASRHWPDAALTLTVFGTCFAGVRLLGANSIKRFGGFRVGIVSFCVELLGLGLLWLAPDPSVALLGAALSGAGFSLVFPALGVEAVGLVPSHSRGAALGAYSVFLDLSLGVTGPVAGLVVSQFGYAQVFLFAALCAALGACLTLGLHRRARRAPHLTVAGAE
ncbi:MAG: MFS transporter [Burkholderiales bacterium]|nr:MFS transporter [Burkholderiales bacterium]MDE2287913.1 MFS transporter [Burkholderiales bacterium]MDE2610308.1 MFS transporter [Burkholderiales bacterium]